jgi:diadenosine tetraphosphate (Ap4A) HIT family hydrolase
VSCLECEVLQGLKAAPGGFVLETKLFVAHALMAPTPLAGWVVLAPRRCAERWWELTDEEARELGPLAKRILLAQRKALGAVHGYAFAIGDVLAHMHLHLIPRYADTPKHLWARGAFDSKPAEHLGEDKILEAIAKLARELHGSPMV